MLFEVYKCVQLNRCSVVCGCVLQRGQRGLDKVGEWAGEGEGGEDWIGELVYLVSVGD